MIYKKLPSIFGILIIPTTCITQAKAIAPRVHIRHKAIAPHILEEISQQNLQVADGSFLKVVATRVAIELRAPGTIHAYHVAGLVQERMDWGVRTNKHTMTNNARFAVTPETACDALAFGLNGQLQPVPLQQRRQRGGTDVVYCQDIVQSVSICFRTIRTRSSTMASRSSASSRALPSTSVES